VWPLSDSINGLSTGLPNELSQQGICWHRCGATCSQQALKAGDELSLVSIRPEAALSSPAHHQAPQGMSLRNPPPYKGYKHMILFDII
jgi:hypothetical protein